MAMLTRSRMRFALDPGVIVSYPLLMYVAIRSVQHDGDGLRVLWPTVVMVAVAVVLRRQPVLVLALMAAGMVAVGRTVSNGDAAFGPQVVTVVWTGAVVAARSYRVSIAATALALVAMIGGCISWRAPAVGIHEVVPYTLMVVVAVTVGLLMRQRREHAESSRAQAARQATTEAITSERLRIARELHDSVAHSIGIIALQAGAARRVFDSQPVRARETLGVVETASREALGELRRMLGALRDTDTPDLTSSGLADLDRLVAATSAAGVRVDVHRTGRPDDLPPEIDRSMFRIAQEALTNVVRHSGTDCCDLFLACHDDAVTVEILDNGPGRPGSSGAGFGLLGMRERVALLHGELSAGPRAEGGYRVAARLPVQVPAR